MIIRGKRWESVKKVEEQIQNNDAKKFSKKDKKQVKVEKVVEPVVAEEPIVDEVAKILSDLEKED